MTLKYSDVELDKINGSKNKDQLIVKYENKHLIIQTNWMTLTHYGIPKNDKFHTTEESRRYLQIPLIENDSFTNFIQSLDEHFSSENFKHHYLSENQQNFNYIPFYKEGKNNYPPSMKFKINVYEDKNFNGNYT